MKILLLLSCLLLFNTVFSQQKSKDYYLERSKKQKKTAWILLGTGSAAIVTGILLEAPHRGTGNTQSFNGGLIEVGGIICTLTSIPFFISSSKNRKKAAALTISNQVLPSTGFEVKSQVSVSLNISLK